MPPGLAAVALAVVVLLIGRELWVIWVYWREDRE